MKKIVIILILIFIIPIKNILGQCPILGSGNGIMFLQSPCNNNPWVLTSTGFNGNNLDPNYWDYAPIFGTSAPAPELASNVLIGSNGNLLLRSTHETPPLIYNGQSCNYTQATIWSKEAKPFLYGKFEIKCKIPSGHGFHPSFFLFGPNMEIDLFEIYGTGSPNCADYTDQVHTNVHYDLTPNSPAGNSYSDNKNCPVTINGPDYSAAMHTYTLIWDPTVIEFYIDNNLVRTYYKYYNYLVQAVSCDNLTIGQVVWPDLIFPDHPMQVVVSIGYEPGCPPDNATTFPAYMEIEYIKIWQRDNGCCISSKSYEATNTLPTNTSVSSNIVAGFDAGIPNTSGNVTVQNGQNVAFSAGNDIDLKPGFVVQPGGVFTGKIQPCTAYTNPSGDAINVIDFPSSFTDKMLVSVNGATSYNIRVDGTLVPYNTYYFAQNRPITSNPVNVWDGTCNQNCGLYNECDKDRTVSIEFMNCTTSLSQSKTVHVNCSKSINSKIKDTLNTDSIAAKNKPNDLLYFKTSPNPCNNYLQLDYSINSSNQIIIDFYTTTGTKQKEFILQYGRNIKTLDISNLQNGVYIYRVYDGNELVKTDKIVVIK